MTARGGAAAAGERSVAAGRDIVGSVVLTGDRATVNVSVDPQDGALLELMRRRAQAVLRDLPLANAPAAFRNHVDRESEAAQILAALSLDRAVEIHGESGVGKTYVLTDVGNRPGAGAEDGIAYVYADGLPRDDILQLLYEEFYDCEAPSIRPSPGRLRRELAGRRALVLVDGLDLGREDVQALVGTAPDCRFVLVSPERRLGEGKSLALRGLDAEFALALVEQELERPLAADEREAAQAVCAALGGHPWRIRSAVSAARDEDRSLADLAASLREGAPAPAAGLSADERRVLAALASVDGASLGVEHLRALAGVADLEGALARLERRHAVESHSPRYSLSGDLAERPGRWAQDEDRERALDYFARRAKDGDRLGAEAPALLALLRWAAASGRDRDAIRLGRAVDASLVLGRRFGAWGDAVQAVRYAAKRTESEPDIAWALHQWGTREFALGREDAARAALEDALERRERLGDERGAEATRQNLRVVTGAGPPGWLSRVANLPTLLGVMIVALALLAGGAAALLARDDDDEEVAATVVPDVVGLTQEAATSTLEAAGFRVRVTEAASDEVPEGVVAAQSPRAGATLAPDGLVTILVSAGGDPPPPPPPPAAETVRVPNVLDLPQARAVAALEELGLVAAVERVPIDDVAEGVVVAQDPQADTEVEPGSTVALSVSLGPAADLAVEIDEEGVDVGCDGGCRTEVTFTVRNLGPGDAPASFEVVVTASGTAEGSIRETVEGLDAGDEETRTVGFTGSCFDPDCSVTVTADPQGAVRDADLSNNADSYQSIG